MALTSGSESQLRIYLLDISQFFSQNNTIGRDVSALDSKIPSCALTSLFTQQTFSIYSLTFFLNSHFETIFHFD